MTWRYFTAAELACKCGCGAEAKPSLIDRLDEARHLAQVPFEVRSGARCEEHNRRVGGVADSSHVGGWAADIEATTSYQRMRVLRAALRAGFERIGISESFVHLDVDPNKPSAVVWTYPPKGKR